MIYLWLKQLHFNTVNPGYSFEYSREHRQQRWYLTVLHNKTDVMVGKTILDDKINSSNVCLFSEFLDISIKKIDRYLNEQRND